MNRLPGLLCAGAVWLLASGCECRPIPAWNWTDLNIQCSAASDFGSNGSDQAIIQSRAELERFLRFDCMPGTRDVGIPAVDFSTRLVIIDVTQSPLVDGTCIKARKVGEVRACNGGVDLLYDDTPDDDCARRKHTGSISVSRDEVRGALQSAGTL